METLQKLANTPNIDYWMKNFERAVLDASEEAVGLPRGQMGNSEVGHLNLGTGRVVYQTVTKIDKAIKDNSLKDNSTLSKSLKRLQSNGGNLHLIGLVSHGGVHSYDTHLNALIRIAKDKQIQVAVHAFTDGRDTDPHSGLNYIKELEHTLSVTGAGVLATVCGRYFGMDRDKRWDRTQKAYDAIFKRKAKRAAPSGVVAVENSYKKDTTDEFIEPTIIDIDKKYNVQPNDCVLFFDF